MAQAGSINQGTLLKYHITGLAPATLVGGITDWSYGGETRTVIQLGSTDSEDSTNDAKAGRRTRGQWSFTVEMDPDSAIQMQAMHTEIKRSSALVNASATQYRWELTFDDTTTATMDGFLVDFGFAGADDGKVTGNLTIQTTEDIDFDTPV